MMILLVVSLIAGGQTTGSPAKGKQSKTVQANKAKPKQTNTISVDPKYQGQINMLQPAVYFAMGETTIDGVGYANIEMVSKYMKKHPEDTIIVRAYTRMFNTKRHQQLTDARAVAVKLALVNRYGIDPGRIIAYGTGDTDFETYPEFNDKVTFGIKM